MLISNSNILEILRIELDFVEDGGYRRSPLAPWRPTYIFEDSPTCPNFDDLERPHPCSTCPWMEFVPVESRDSKWPCRAIPLTQHGETLEHLYRHANQLELEEALTRWLHRQINCLQEAWAAPTRAQAEASPDAEISA